EAERLFREGIRLVDPTQYVTDRALARLDLAGLLRLAGRIDDARTALEEAIVLFEQKGNVLSVERARRLLDDLEADPGGSRWPRGAHRLSGDRLARTDVRPFDGGDEEEAT